MRVQFETKTCNRCGGGGQYSYNAMHGTTCFKCRGYGKVLSEQGAKARTTYRAFRLNLCGTPAREVQPGDRIKLSNGWHTIAEVRMETESDAAYGRESVELRYNGGRHVMEAGTQVLHRPTAEKLKQLLQYGATLTGAELVNYQVVSRFDSSESTGTTPND